MVEYISDVVAVMYLGQIIEQSPSRALYRAPLHPYTIALLSSIPSLNPRRRARSGSSCKETSQPRESPGRCRFNPRCPLADARCKSEVPKLIQLGEHTVHCHRVEELVARHTRRSKRRSGASRSAEPADRPTHLS